MLHFVCNPIKLCDLFRFCVLFKFKREKKGDGERTEKYYRKYTAPTACFFPVIFLKAFFDYNDYSNNFQTLFFPDLHFTELTVHIKQNILLLHLFYEFIQFMEYTRELKMIRILFFQNVAFNDHGLFFPHRPRTSVHFLKFGFLFLSRIPNNTFFPLLHDIKDILIPFLKLHRGQWVSDITI